ncbi:MAG: hypothetical protein ACRDJG_09640 [Actinomycetota bacterium]
MSRGRPRRPGRRSAIVIAWTLAVISGGLMWEVGHRCVPARAATEPASRPVLAISASPTPPSPPPRAPSPGVRQPLVGGLGVLAILVAAAAGFFIYRQIRRGL